MRHGFKAGVHSKLFVRAGEVFLAFLQLGCTSFGGPIAHLGYFRKEFVERRRWLDDATFGEIVALAQFLPGPSSSQVGMALGLMRAGTLGMFVAWTGFTLPSVVLLLGFATASARIGGSIGQGLTHGLMVVAVAVVAQAVMQMAGKLTPDVRRRILALVSLAVLLVLPMAIAQIAVLIAAGVIGYFVLTPPAQTAYEPMAVPVSPAMGSALIATFFALLVMTPLLAGHGGAEMQLIDIFYRTGAMVFGGGHVVLPILEADLVPKGLIARDVFFAGYGAAQAVPGPLFSFAAFVGMMSESGGFGQAMICLLALFAPSFLLVPGVLPFWSRLSGRLGMRAALMGVNAAVVGLLAAALVTPIFTTAIHSYADLGLALLAFAGLNWSPLPVWVIVVICGAAGVFFL
jgi:chromate transporter